MRRKEALYAVIGGVVGAILTMVVGSFSPLGAQSQSDVSFGKITCKELVVENKDGSTAAYMAVGEYGGLVGVYGKDGGMAFMGVGEDGVIVAVHGKDGKSSASMRISEEYGGMVGETDKNGVTTLLNPD